MTLSIVAFDHVTGTFGAAVASHVLACGAGVPAVATDAAVVSQARSVPRASARALEQLRAGGSAAHVANVLLAADSASSERQLGLIDSAGHSWTYTGSHCFSWAGGVAGPGFATQGNILVGPVVVDAMADRYARGGLPFRSLLLASLAAGMHAGGDSRGAQSAALLTARMTELGEERVDLRVDDHADPVGELLRLMEVYATLGDVSQSSDLIRLDARVARDLRRGLRRAGVTPTRTRFPRMSSAEPPAPLLAGIGDPASYAGGWGAGWQRCLNDWMEVENLELRAAAPGWVDRRVLSRLRSI